HEALFGEAPDDPEEQTAERIHDERAPREPRAEEALDDAGEPEPRERAERPDGGEPGELRGEAHAPLAIARGPAANARLTVRAGRRYPPPMTCARCGGPEVER